MPSLINRHILGFLPGLHLAAGDDADDSGDDGDGAGGRDGSGDDGADGGDDGCAGGPPGEAVTMAVEQLPQSGFSGRMTIRWKVFDVLTRYGLGDNHLIGGSFFWRKCHGNGDS